MKYILPIVGVISFIVMISLAVYFSFTPSGKEKWNNWFYKVQTADDHTDYDARKKVEDTCRAMISSYKSDELTYQQYKDSENEEKQGWSEQAKMRANKTANSYNHYILKNNYVWKDNIPEDIVTELGIIE